jgi:hypothetical protein
MALPRRPWREGRHPVATVAGTTRVVDGKVERQPLKNCLRLQREKVWRLIRPQKITPEPVQDNQYNTSTHSNPINRLGVRHDLHGSADLPVTIK